MARRTWSDEEFDLGVSVGALIGVGLASLGLYLGVSLILVALVQVGFVLYRGRKAFR